MMSFGPPGAKGTTTRTGREGYSCALVPGASSAAARQALTAARNFVIVCLGEGGAMRQPVSTLLILLAAAAPAAHAQELDETQRGRQIFAQSCGICHLQPSLGVKTYG